MALNAKVVLSDTPSEVVAELRRQFNALLEAIDGLAALASVDDLKAAVAAKTKTVVAEPKLQPASPHPTRAHVKGE